MIAIADNLNMRNKVYADALARRNKKTVTEVIKKIMDAGADIINVQCSLDGAGDEDTLPWVIGISPKQLKAVCLLIRGILSPLKRLYRYARSRPSLISSQKPSPKTKRQ